MRTVYVAEDGVCFESIKKCEEYEKRLSQLKENDLTRFTILVDLTLEIDVVAQTEEQIPDELPEEVDWALDNIDDHPYNITNWNILKRNPYYDY